jgi:CheY-like chemotaxis protein
VHTIERGSTARAARTLHKVVVVDGNPDVLDLLETALDGGQYDLSFAEAGQHAYTVIRREKPDLVVLSVRTDTLDGFQLLSMLKLDPDTKDIPVVTYASDVDGDDDPAENEGMDYTPHRPMRLH